MPTIDYYSVERYSFSGRLHDMISPELDPLERMHRED